MLVWLAQWLCSVLFILTALWQQILRLVGCQEGIEFTSIVMTLLSISVLNSFAFRKIDFIHDTSSTSPDNLANKKYSIYQLVPSAEKYG